MQKIMPMLNNYTNKVAFMNDIVKYLKNVINNLDSSRL